MLEVFAPLLFLIFLVAIWAALGHVIWLGAAAVVRAAQPRTCPHCRGPHRASECVLLPPADAAAARPADDVAAARRLIQLAAFKRWIPTDAALRVSRRLDELQLKIEAEASHPDVLPQGPRTTAASASTVATASSIEFDPAASGIEVGPAIAAMSRTSTVSGIEFDSTVSGAEPGSAVAVSPQPAAFDRSPGDPPAALPRHALEREYTPPVSVKRPPIAKRLTADVLKSFMEQSNIRWVELVSATLVVVCSVGLVISLWSTLSSTSRYFPSLVFLAATVAVHAAGQYTLHRWKLRSTSRGILHIGLMLIPLAILVGILLARRPGQPPSLSLSALAAIAVGGCVYASLAVTASRSLFGGGWPVVTAGSIAAGGSMVPVYYFGRYGWLGALPAAAVLLPLVGVSLWASAAALPRRRRGGPAARRAMGVVAQSLFAAGAAMIFWHLMAGGTSNGWWLAAASIAAGWAAWGWAASKPQENRQVPRPRDGMSAESAAASPRGPAIRSMLAGRKQAALDRSLLSVTGWVVAAAAATLVAAGLWRVFDDRRLLPAMLAACGGWWLLYGGFARLRTIGFAGAFALLGCVALLGEMLVRGSGRIEPIDWLSKSRVLSLSAVSIAAIAVGWWSRSRGERGQRVEVRAGKRGIREAFDPRQLGESFFFGGLAVAGVSAGLVLLACLVPFGATPYGGDWAPLMLTIYGTAAIAMACVTAKADPNVKPRSGPQDSDNLFIGAPLADAVCRYLTPIGQAILLFGVYRLCENGEALADVLASLRPGRAWSAGGVAVAILWTATAVALRPRGDRSEDARSDGGRTESRPLELLLTWLVGGSLAVGLVAAVAIWTRPDGFAFAAMFGWYVPMLALGGFYALRNAYLREVATLTAAVWALTATYAIGRYSEIWNRLSILESVTVFVAVTAAIAVGVEWLKLQVRGGQAETAKPSDLWHSTRTHWAAAVLLTATATALTVAALLPAADGWASNLKLARPGQLWWGRGATNVGLSAAVAIAAAISVGASWVARRRGDAWLRSLPTWFPIFTVALAGAAAAMPYALAASLWVASLWLIAGELSNLRLPAPVRRLASLAAFRMPDAKRSIAGEEAWAGLFLLQLLVAGTAATVATAASRGLPEELFRPTADVMGNAMRLMLWLGPPLAFAVVGWLSGVASDNPKLSIVAFAYAAAALVGATAWLAVETVSRGSAAVLSPLAAAVSASTLAWFTVAVPAARGAAGLRVVAGGQISWRAAFARAARGKRGQRAAAAAATVNDASLVLLTALSLWAIAAVALYAGGAWSGPGRFGGPTAWLAFALTIGFLLFDANRRGLGRGPLFAAAVGLAGPLAAAGYAGWLLAAQGGLPAGTRSMEPIRLMIAMWLAAAAFDLAWSTWRRGRGEAAVESAAAPLRLNFLLWTSAAAGVSLAAAVTDFNRLWPLGFLSCTAALLVLREHVSGNRWLGHVAAVLAAAGLSGWLFHIPGLHGFEAVWLVLWGPLWVAGLSLAVRLAMGPRTPQAAATKPTAMASVDRQVSWQLPTASLLLSGVWLLIQQAELTVAGGGTVGPATTGLGFIVGLTLACLAVSVARLRDPRSGQRGLALYLSVLAASVTGAIAVAAAAELQLLEAWLLWVIAALAAMAAVAGSLRGLWSGETTRQRRWLLPVGVERDRLIDAGQRLATYHSLAAMAALVPCVLLIVRFDDRSLRLFAAAIPMLGAAAVLPLAGGRSASLHRHVGLGLLSAFWVMLWWANYPVEQARGVWEVRWDLTQRTFAALASLAVALPLVATRWRGGSEWMQAFVRFGWAALMLAYCVGITSLAAQTGLVGPSFLGQSIAATAGGLIKAAVIVAWTAIAARLLQFAARPLAVDGSKGRGVREFAVYAAEIAVACLTAACYFFFPNLFAGVLKPYWPLIVFGIAMLSAGIGAWLERVGEDVIGDPVRRSSLLLTLIPLIGVWWVQPSVVGWDWAGGAPYALLLLLAAGLFAVQGWMRTSTPLKGLSAVLTVASFWTLLHSQPELNFTEHPQFWLLPVALATLVYLELRRGQLDERVAVPARYAAVLVAYLSSTAETLLTSAQGRLWEPLILLALAIAGVGAGVVLRVRSFLYCGTAFVAVALVTMVWHAQQAIGQVWPWWAFGIATGVTLIALLGYFEKNRPRVSLYLEELRRWEN